MGFKPLDERRKRMEELSRQFGTKIPAIPTLADEFVLLRQLERKQRLAAMRGRASTFLTGPRGIGFGLPTSEIAAAFLRAQIDEEPDYLTVTDTMEEKLLREEERRRRRENPETNEERRRRIAGARTPNVSPSEGSGSEGRGEGVGRGR